jgi:hypothetical protein
MPDLGPNKKRIAQLFRMLGSSGGERRNAFAALERVMQSEGINWTDIGDVIANGGEPDNGKYTETEMQEFAQAARAEGVDAGIKIGTARAGIGNGSANGQVVLPKSFEMAEYCHDRLSQLKDTKQRDFVNDMRGITQRGARLSPSRLSYLVSIYIKVSGTTG